MTAGQSLSRLTVRLLTKLDATLLERKPDLILAQGDTTTCFATAVSSFYRKIPFFHVEAGLRTYKSTPFPEEFNRQTIAPIASHHFAPTAREKKNLTEEGISDGAITVTGSTVHDAIRMIEDQVGFVSLSPYNQSVVVTLHRRESIENTHAVLAAVRQVALENQNFLFICPVHPNPTVKSAFQKCLGGVKNIQLLKPQKYPRFISHLIRSTLILTDSGGVQEEAAFFGKKVLLARTETERLDGIHSGSAQLVGYDSEVIYRSLVTHLKRPTPETTEVLQRNPASNQSPSQLIAQKVLQEVI